MKQGLSSGRNEPSTAKEQSRTEGGEEDWAAMVGWEPPRGFENRVESYSAGGRTEIAEDSGRRRKLVGCETQLLGEEGH